MKTSHPDTKLLKTAIASIMLLQSLLNSPWCPAAATVWHADIPFTAFQGSPGGFEKEGPGNLVLASNSTAAGSPGTTSSRSYDVLKQTGTMAASEGDRLKVYSLGQDGTPDMTIRTKVYDYSEGRWDVWAERRRDTYRGKISVTSGTSRPGDCVMVGYEITLNSDLETTASDVALRLASINGTGEIYEWAFISTADINNPPVDVTRFREYAQQYGWSRGGLALQ
jgi:hypothetical protein